jgi:formate dehydrogenase subunit gamma
MTNRTTNNPMGKKRSAVRRLFGYLGVAAIAGAALAAVVTLSATGSDSAYAQFRETPHSAPPPDIAARQGLAGPEAVPGNAAVHGILPRADLWRSVRHGISGRVSIADKKAGVLVQSEGENFRIVQDGPLPNWGGWLMLGMIVALAAFFAYRGRIRVESGYSGHMIQRFSVLDRFAHWLSALSFIVLGLTGLNILYGRYVLKPIMGASAFATVTAWGKYTHDFISFLFMIGLVLMFVLWVRNNLFTKADLIWALKGGGMFTRGVDPPAYKYNAGQKFVFWCVVLGGFSVAFSGICLLLPFELHPFAPTFKFLNLFGLHLPTVLTSLEETQLALIWHAIMALLLITLIFVHSYIGSLGMEGAFDTMISGKVDENWAREHHSLWLEELKKETPGAAAGQPAE